MRNIWTNQELKWLINNYGNYDLQKCQIILNKPKKTIINKASQLKIKSSAFWKQDEIEYLINNYENINISLLEMSLFLKRTEEAICAKSFKLGLGNRKGKFGNPKYNINHNYFSVIDTKDKAYFLGFLMADGYNTGKGIVISLQEKDKHILEILAKYLNYTGELYTKLPTGKAKQIQKTLNICSYKISEDLSKLGCVKKKSHFAYFPDIPEEFYSHFIRGVFDGDGCVSLNKKQNSLSFSIVGNLKLIEKVQEILIKECNLKKTKLIKLKLCKGDIYLVCYNGTTQSRKIAEYLYKNCENLFLTRKKSKFINSINRRNKDDINI